MDDYFYCAMKTCVTEIFESISVPEVNSLISHTINVTTYMRKCPWIPLDEK